MKLSVGMRSLALAFPRIVRGNDYWKEKYPKIVATAEKHALAKLWNGPGEVSGDPFDVAMAPYLKDPFRGAVQRRIRAPEETSRSMEVRAALGALSAAGMTPNDPDMTLVSSLLSDQQAVGNAAYLAGELGLRGPAITFESACASSAVGLRMAMAYIRSGECQTVLVVVSNSGSVQLDESDTLSWFVGDGAAAFVVSALPEGQGLLGSCTVSTHDTCDMFRCEPVYDPVRGVLLRTRAHKRAGEMAKVTAPRYLQECCSGALKNAGVSLEDIDFFVFHSPTAFYPAFCAKVLSVPKERWISTYPDFANIGSVVMPATLHVAAREGRIKPGQLVLAYAVGSSSTASAVVMRWGDVALGPDPDPGIPG